MKNDDLFIVLLGDVAIPVRDPGCRQVQGGVDTEAADSGLWADGQGTLRVDEESARRDLTVYAQDTHWVKSGYPSVVRGDH